MNTKQTDDDSDSINILCDDDSVNHSHDNCPNLANSDQADGNGDAYDADDDKDLLADDDANLPAASNTDQSDIDSAGFGDVYNNDTDGCLVDNELDQCPATTAA